MNLKIVLLVTFGLALASVFGYLSQRAKLSPILGYLFAGYLIGPYSPGFIADMEITEQLAEIGVILMMFGVGLHFKLDDLVKVKNIAIPGAIGQTLAAATVGGLLIHWFGWSWHASIIIGLAIGVASTVVLVRILSDNDLLHTPQGHVAIGWLIVEDILTVAILILIPTIASTTKGEQLSVENISLALGLVVLKFAMLAAIVFTIGKKIVTYVLNKIAELRSHELFTLTILALTFVIATGSSLLFGTSMALGAFIAGMVIGQTEVSHQASVNSLPMKDLFVVLFFLSVGTLFNPSAILNNFPVFLIVLAVILLVKPISAFLITLALKHPINTAVTVSLALAQIGEFSFILAEEAMRFNLLPEEGYDVIVASALVSISINPMLFKTANNWFGMLTSRMAPAADDDKEYALANARHAIVVGYGPIGQMVSNTLILLGYTPIIIDQNIYTIKKLRADGWKAVFGDASQDKILEIAHIKTAKILAITIPKVNATCRLIETARQLNPDIQILVRTRYHSDQELFQKCGADYVCCEEDEASKAFNEAICQLGQGL